MVNLFTPPSARRRSIVANAREQLEAEAKLQGRGIPLPLQVTSQDEAPVETPPEILTAPEIEVEPEIEVVSPAEDDPMIAEAMAEVELGSEEHEDPIDEDVDEIVLEALEEIESVTKNDLEPEYVIPEYTAKSTKTTLLEIAKALKLDVSSDNTKAEILAKLEKATA